MQKRWTRKSIKELQERLALTQDEFARAVGVSYVTVNRWINGHAKPQRLAEKALDELKASRSFREGG